MNLIWPQYANFLDEMSLLWAILILPIGLAILIKGADWLVDGAVAIAKQLGMSPLIIGLTIVAMGTSAPEVAASVKAALGNSPGIAVGNVYGSNIANLALVGGLCAIIRPISVSRAALRRDIPLMLGAALLLYPLFSLDRTLGRGESILMLVLFAGVILFMIHSERMRARKDTRVLEKTASNVEHAAPHQPKSIWLSLFVIFIGLICLAEGAGLTVSTAQVIGDHAGLKDTAIGATIIAVCTSLPELITCLIAAIKGHDDLSVGNLVGSNIFNTLLVIGTAGLVKPFSIASSPELVGWDYWLMILVLILFSVIAFVFRKIPKPAGILLFACYAGYIAYSFGLFSGI
ncbi:MAG: calcium/sodium antiporter [Planctomycetota bacterium]|jgi:cation:H+ antiporter